MSEQANETVATPTTPGQQTEYAALKAAVEAAQAEEGGNSAEDAPKPPTLKPKTNAPKMGTEGTPAIEETPADDPDTDLPKIAKLLKAREKARETEIQAKKASDDMLADARKQVEKMLEEGRAALKRERDEMHEGYSRKLKSNPYKFIEEHGLDREQLINEVAREGTPEWQMMKRQESTIDELRAELKELKAFREDYKKQSEESRINSQRYAIQQVEKQFLAACTLDLAPNLRKLYEDSEIISKGHALARRLREETGEDASLEDLRDHLEYEAKQRVAKWSSGPSDSGKANASKTKANGSRTLSTNALSERRAVPKTFKEAKTPDEELALLEQVAAEAMGSAG